MKFLNSFIHGNALAEIFVEGHNPYAQQKLDTADVDAMRQQLRTSEALKGYVIGRIVESGRGVWLVTDQSVIVRSAGFQGAQRLDLTQVESFEAVRGGYGHTVRLKAQGRSWSLFGVDRELAGQMHRAFAAAGIASTFEDKPARSAWWRDASPAGWMQDCLQDARLRLSLG